MNTQPSPCFHSLSVIVLAVNETKSLTETVDTVVGVCSKDDLAEVIICPADYASPACINTATQLCEKYREVPVCMIMQNGSFEDAMKKLFRTVKGSHFIIQPADLEEDPKMIATFIEKCRYHPEAVITGSRFISKTGLKDFNYIKRVFIYIYHIFFNMIFARKLTDTTFMYSAIPTFRMSGIILKEKSYPVLYEAFLKLLRTGVEVIELPAAFQKSKERKSQVKFFRDGLRYLRVLFRVRFADIKSFSVNDFIPETSE